MSKQGVLKQADIIQVQALAVPPLTKPCREAERQKRQGQLIPSRYQPRQKHQPKETDRYLHATTPAL
jgi:hypothetical protein